MPGMSKIITLNIFFSLLSCPSYLTVSPCNTLFPWALWFCQTFFGSPDMFVLGVFQLASQHTNTKLNNGEVLYNLEKSDKEKEIIFDTQLLLSFPDLEDTLFRYAINTGILSFTSRKLCRTNLKISDQWLFFFRCYLQLEVFPPSGCKISYILWANFQLCNLSLFSELLRNHFVFHKQL